MPPSPPRQPYTPRSDRFAIHLAELVAFLEASGGRYPSRVIARDEAELRLAIWVMYARGGRRSAGLVLTPGQCRQLEALPGWRWATDGTPLHQQRRRARLEECVRTVTAAARRCGSVRFPRGYRLPDCRNPVNDLRHLRITRVQGLMPDDLARKLERLPSWTWKRWRPDPVPDLDGWLALLDRYIASHGHTRIPVEYRVGTAKLGRWVSRMRTFQRKGRLAPEMIAALEARPAWQWNPHGYDLPWEPRPKLLPPEVRLKTPPPPLRVRLPPPPPRGR